MVVRLVALIPSATRRKCLGGYAWPLTPLVNELRPLTDRRGALRNGREAVRVRMLTETARRRWLFLGSCVLALVAVSAVEPQQGRAAQLIGRDVHGLRLEADRGGEALLLFTAQGKPNHVLVWGALNARPPSGHVPQVQFRVDYSGGWKKYRHVGLGKPYWQTFSNACRPYTGPTLLYQIAACDAPDGSYLSLIHI